MGKGDENRKTAVRARESQSRARVHTAAADSYLPCAKLPLLYTAAAMFRLPCVQLPLLHTAAPVFVNEAPGYYSGG